MKRTRRPTPRPPAPEVFAAPVPPAIPDPTCARACGVCWACRRAKDGPLYYLRGRTT